MIGTTDEIIAGALVLARAPSPARRPGEEPEQARPGKSGQASTGQCDTQYERC